MSLNPTSPEYTLKIQQIQIQTQTQTQTQTHQLKSDNMQKSYMSSKKLEINDR